MNTSKLPCLYYPTTATLIDDDQIFSENLIANLADHIPYQQFDTPSDALDFFKSQQDIFPTPSDFFNAPLDSSDDVIEHGRYAVNVNLNEVCNQLYNKSRFTIPSVIVVDHDMPGMNGIEFCQRLRDYPMKKIMLTGVADHKLAINAFNNGTIHKFILKDDPNVFETIDAAIFEMQQSYFANLSDLIVHGITANTFSYLEEKFFIDFFWKFIEKNQIAEFYLIDPIGSFLLLNKQGELLWLIIKSDQSILNDQQIAVGQNASNDIIQTLAERKKILFLFSEEDYKQPVENWPSYLYPAKKIDSAEGCYYSVIQGESAYKIAGICKDKIFSYNNYLNFLAK